MKKRIKNGLIEASYSHNTHRQHRALLHTRCNTHEYVCHTPLFRHFSMTKKSKITMDDSQQQTENINEKIPYYILQPLLIKHFHVKHVLYHRISVFPNACLQNSYSIQCQLKNCTIDVSILKYKGKILSIASFTFTIVTIFMPKVQDE